MKKNAFLPPKKRLLRLLAVLSVLSMALCPAHAANPSDASDFVVLTDIVPSAILEVRYYSDYNFVGERIDGYEEPLVLVTRETAEALKRASEALAKRGYRFKVFDGYRPQMAVDHFVRWAKDERATEMKASFYPDVDKSRLFEQGYIAQHSGHSRGSTIDLTLFDDRTGAEVDMGSPFDFFGEKSHPDYTKGLTEEQIANRRLLREVMLEAGFKPLDEEWWHFTLCDEPYPDTYFTFAVNSDTVAPENRIPTLS